MPFKIIRNDITKVEADVIVNAANPMLKMGAGVCGAIFNAAGKEALQKECDAIGRCGEGEAVITSAYALPAKYIIHAVGPIWFGGYANEEQFLKDAYTNSMELALSKKCESIAFPLISTGLFGYPKEKALEAAISAISDFLERHELMVFLVVFDRESFKISEKRLYDIEKFIDDNYVDEISMMRASYRQNEREFLKKKKRIEHVLEDKLFEAEPAAEIDIQNPRLDETFSQRLLRLIDERGMTDPQAYRRANVTRQHFSKIRNKAGYTPSKETAVAFAIALELNIDDTADLLKTAGLALSRSILFDVIIEYHIRKGIYNTHEINEILFSYDQPLLGA